MKAFPPKIRHKTRLSALTPLFYLVWEVLDSAVRQERDVTAPDWRGGRTLPLFADDMILYAGNPQEHTQTPQKSR